MREHADYLAAYVGYCVGAYEHKPKKVCGDCGRERGEVRAHVGVHCSLQSGYGAVAVARYLPVADVVASVGGGEVVFLAALDPLDGLGEVLGNDEGDDLFGVQVELAAEAAAHVRRDYADLVLGVAGDQRKQQPHQVGNLRRRPERDMVGARVVVGDNRPTLHGVGDESLVDDTLRYAHLGLARGLVDVSAADLPLEAFVVGHLVVYQRRAVLRGLLGVRHGVQRLVVHVHERGGVGGDRRVCGDHGGHRVAHAADLADG